MRKSKRLKFILCLTMALMVLVIGAVPVYAQSVGEMAEGAARKLLLSVMWIAILVAIGGGAYFALVKKNASQAVVTILIASFIAMLCYDPLILIKFGEMMLELLGL